MRIPYHGTPPISGEMTDLLTGFFTQHPPLSRVLFPLDPLSWEHYGDPYSISFIFILFSSGLRNKCTYFLITLGGRTTDIQYNKGPTLPPPFLFSSGGY